MYSERVLCRKIKNELSYALAHVIKSKQMLAEKRPPQDIFCQVRAAQGGIKKIIDDLFFEAVYKNVTMRINALLASPHLSDEQAETLMDIQKVLAGADAKKLLRMD